MDSDKIIKKCGDCGKSFQLNKMFSEWTTLCPSCAEAYRPIAEAKEKEEQEKEERQEKEQAQRDWDRKTQDIVKNHSRYLELSRVGPRHSQATMDDFGDGEKKQEIMNWLNGPLTEFVLIQGSNSGTGKTHLASAMMLSFIKKTHKRALFVPAVDMLLAVRDTFNDDVKATETQVIENWQIVDLLVIDDLGTEKTSDYSQQVMYQVVSTRYNNKLPTIVTTNASSADIKEKNGTRIFSRIASGLVVVLDGADLRAANRVVAK